jgi:hypothetical protein
MIPQETAKRLMLRFSILNKEHNHLVKHCATIAAQEIINELRLYGINYSYWEEVIIEIDKLHT